jgi:fucokinase
VQALEEIQHVAVLMRDELERGRVDGFAALMNRHWEQSRHMDAGCTNARIERIFEVTADLLDGKMCVGSGGGGFLQVIMKPGVTRRQLDQRLGETFGDRSVATWDCAII